MENYLEEFSLESLKNTLLGKCSGCNDCVQAEIAVIIEKLFSYMNQVKAIIIEEETIAITQLLGLLSFHNGKPSSTKEEILPSSKKLDANNSVNFNMTCEHRDNQSNRMLGQECTKIARIYYFNIVNRLDNELLQELNFNCNNRSMKIQFGNLYS